LRSPGRSALKTCSEDVSFQSTLVLATACASRANELAGALSKSGHHHLHRIGHHGIPHVVPAPEERRECHH
jgi:hypothetical protein